MTTPERVLEAIKRMNNPYASDDQIATTAFRGKHYKQPRAIVSRAIRALIKAGLLKKENRKLIW